MQKCHAHENKQVKVKITLLALDAKYIKIKCTVYLQCIL